MPTRYFVALLVSLVSVVLGMRPLVLDAQQASSDLDAAVGLYVQSHGAIYRHECAALATSVETGTCYEATLRSDGDAEVWLTNLATNSGSLLLFADGAAGWTPFTRPIDLAGSAPAVDAFAPWSDALGWRTYVNGNCLGYPGVCNLDIKSDGSGTLGAGRFDAATLELSSFQDGIAVGSLTLLKDNVDPDSQSITSVSPLRSTSVAFVLLGNGTSVLTSTLLPANLSFGPSNSARGANTGVVTRVETDCTMHS